MSSAVSDICNSSAMYCRKSRTVVSLLGVCDERFESETGLRCRDPRKNSSCVGARRMNILRLRGFFGGEMTFLTDCSSDCSAVLVNKGGSGCNCERCLEVLLPNGF